MSNPRVLIRYRQGAAGAKGDKGDPGSDAEVTQPNMEAAIIDKPGFRSATQVSPGASAYINLWLPTYDGDQRVVHVDVVDCGAKWNGYRYWMTYTPYPDSTREYPSVCASNDLVNWELPAGCPNPLANPEVVDPGTSNLADVDIVQLPNGNLAIYFVSSKQGLGAYNKVYRLTSADGVTWTQSAVLFQVSDSRAASPAVVVEADNTFSMWVGNAPDGRVDLRTSADGVTWSAATACTIPALPAGYVVSHVDVVRRNGGYGMLLHIATGTPPYDSQLVYLTSSNKTVWTGSMAFVIPPMGGHINTTIYRSGLLPSSLGDDRWDVFLSGVDAAQPLGAAQPRIHLLRGMLLDATEPVVPVACSEFEKLSERFGLPGIDTIRPSVSRFRGPIGIGNPSILRGLAFEFYNESLASRGTVRISGAGDNTHLSESTMLGCGWCRISGLRYSSGNPVAGDWASSLTGGVAVANYSSTTQFHGPLPCEITLTAVPDNVTPTAGSVITTAAGASAVIHRMTSTTRCVLRDFGGTGVFAGGAQVSINGVPATSGGSAVNVGGNRVPVANCMTIYLVPYHASVGGGYYQAHNSFAINSTLRVSYRSH